MVSDFGFQDIETKEPRTLKYPPKTFENLYMKFSTEIPKKLAMIEQSSSKIQINKDETKNISLPWLVISNIVK